jgi:hypothetical protein
MRYIACLLFSASCLFQYCSNGAGSAAPPSPKPIYKKCILDFCFEHDVPAIDSIKMYNGKLEETDAMGYLLYVYDIAKEDTTLLRNQCVEKKYSALPLPDGLAPGVIEDHFDKADKGYYHILEKRSGFFRRLEIVDFTKKKFILFQLGS